MNELQSERTVLAWWRTTLGATGITVLALRAWMMHRSVIELAVLLCCAAGLAALVAVTLMRHPHHRAAAALMLTISGPPAMASLCVLAGVLLG